MESGYTLRSAMYLYLVCLFIHSTCVWYCLPQDEEYNEYGTFFYVNIMAKLFKTRILFRQLRLLLILLVVCNLIVLNLLLFFNYRLNAEIFRTIPSNAPPIQHIYHIKEIHDDNETTESCRHIAPEEKTEGMAINKVTNNEIPRETLKLEKRRMKMSNHWSDMTMGSR